MVSEIKKSGLLSFLVFVFISLVVLPSLVFASPVSLKIEGDIIYLPLFGGDIERWSLDSGSFVDSFEQEGLPWTFDTDYENFFVVGDDGFFYTYNIESAEWKQYDVINNTAISQRPLVYDAESGYLFLSDDEVIAVWDVDNEELVKRLEGHEYSVVGFDLDEDYIYSLSSEGVVKTWDKQSLDLVKNWATSPDSQTMDLILDSEPAWELVVEGDLAYTGHLYGNMRIWDLSTGSLVKTVRAHIRDVKGFFSDGKYMYTSAVSIDRKVKIWDLQGELAGPVLDIGALGYHPVRLIADETYLYVGVREGGVLVYEKDTWELKKRIGNFVETQQDVSQSQAPSKGKTNPIWPIFIIVVLFLAVAVIIEAFVYVRKESRAAKSKKSEFSKSATLKKFFALFIKPEDILKILGVASIIILVLGIFKTSLVFPRLTSSIKFIYYFDVIVNKSALLPVWFILLPTLAYLATKKHKPLIRYLASLGALAVAVLVYLFSPKLI